MSVGGVFYQAGNASLKNSVFIGNYNIPTASNDGSCGALLARECTCDVEYCAVLSNHQRSYGYGLLTTPSVTYYHASGHLRNCTVVDNTSMSPYSDIVGFDFLNFATSWTNPTVENCIIRYNLILIGNENNVASTLATVASNVKSSQGNPGFLDHLHGDCRIRPPSTAIDTGMNFGQTSDILGNQVPTGAAPDMGAYEFAPMSYALWAAQNGLAGTNALPASDPDLDGRPNQAEYVLQLDPNRYDGSNGMTVALEPFGGTNYLTVSLTPPVFATDVVVSAESSIGLNGWSNTVTKISSAPVLKFRDNVPASTSNQRLMRLNCVLTQ
jgi:hypothetical protein